MSTTLEAVTAGAEQIEAQVRRVAKLRRRQGEVDSKIKQARTAFLENIKPLTEEAEQLNSECVSAEAMLRESALARYEQTKETRPTAGVQVAVYKEPVYDPQKADEWSREHKIARIPERVIPEQLDRKAFERIARLTSLDFVEWKEGPRVRIATDLEKALAKAAQ
jgi:hypothetical protein